MHQCSSIFAHQSKLIRNQLYTKTNFYFNNSLYSYCSYSYTRILGHIALLFHEYNRAQELFLASSEPEAALQMRRDLLQWESALKLARALMSKQLPEVCVHYAQQLENKDDIDTALRLFESALQEQDMNGKIILPCQPGTLIYKMAIAGVARCNLRLGMLFFMYMHYYNCI